MPPWVLQTPLADPGLIAFLWNPFDVVRTLRVLARCFVFVSSARTEAVLLVRLASCRCGLQLCGGSTRLQLLCPTSLPTLFGVPLPSLPCWACAALPRWLELAVALIGTNCVCCVLPPHVQASRCVQPNFSVAPGTLAIDLRES